MNIDIIQLSHEGFGIGKTNQGKIIFVPKTIPGEIVDINIQKENSKFAHGFVNSLTQPSPDRVEAFCPYFNNCGGCDFQMISYQQQLKWKATIFQDILTRIGGISDSSTILQIIGMKGECPKFYRNKIRFAFLKDNNEIKFSRHNRSNPQADIIVDKCFLQSERSNRILKILAEWAKSNHLSIFDDQTEQGYLKYVLIREGKMTQDLMIDITTTEGQIESKLCHDLLARLTDAKIISEHQDLRFSLFQTETSGISNSRTKLNHLYGSEFIQDQIGEYTFQISHDSFFQTNSIMAKTIYDTVLKFLKPKPSDLVWDLFCGTGTIGIYVAQKVSQVLGIESCQPAIENAKLNAKLNQIQNIEFILGRVETQNFTSLQKTRRPSAVIIDPPRAGLNGQTKQFLTRSKINRIIYVSCNPQTLARDLKELTESQIYQIKQIQPIDCFPHTHHIESVTLLQHN